MSTMPVANGAASVTASDDRIADAIARLSGPIPDHELHERCLDATALLEQIPPAGYADSRVQLAWQVTNALLHDQKHADTCVRALLAAYQPGVALKERIWERRWLTALAVMERFRGNIVTSLKAEVAGLDLAQEIGDLSGQAAALSHLAVHAVLGARFEEALQLSDAAIRTAAQGSVLPTLSNVYVIRGNTLLYLGRYDDAFRNACEALLVTGPGAGIADKRRAVMAKALAAESLIALGRLSEAAVAVDSAELWATESSAAPLLLESRRVRALLDVALGETQRGLSVLQELRHDVQSPAIRLDLLQSEYRARLMASDDGGALRVLEHLRSHFIEQTEHMLRGLREAPALARYLQHDGRLAHLDRYLESKRLLTRVASPASNSWEYLISLAAASISPEDPTLEHGLRVGCLSALVAAALHAPDLGDDVMLAAGLVHDVGKVGIPPEVLKSQEPLSESEIVLVAEHAETGAQLLEQADFPHKRAVINAARYHHCTFDGIGVHSPLRGDAIPLEARIVAVCDAFDGLLTGRPRLPALPVARALEELLRRAGRDFDPAVVAALVDVCRRLPADSAALLDVLSAKAQDIPYFASRRAWRTAVAKP